MTELPFTSGPRLSPPKADPTRQAIDSLRGYAYQLYVSALAWVELGDEEVLFLEVAEDYAVAADQALRAVQVKDTAASGPITIRSKGVRDALDAFVDLVSRNPGLDITLRFLSTSPIGREREKAGRAGNEGTLHYWRRAAIGADVAPLRAVLGKVALSNNAIKFISERDDEQLRDDLLRRVHWDCGQPDLDAVRDELDRGLVRLGKSRFGLPASEVGHLRAPVLQHLLATIVKPSDRRLDRAKLFELLDDATRVSLPRRDLEILFASVARILGGGQDTTEIAPRSRGLEPEANLPLPSLLANRGDLVTATLEQLRRHGTSVLTGGTGMGKTIVARLCARRVGGEWFILDLRDESAREAAERLRIALAAFGEARPRGVILDDFGEAENPEVGVAAARFVSAARRRDVLCVFTVYSELSARTLSEIGLDRTATLTIPYLTRKEVGELVAAAGGDPEHWLDAIYWVAAFGHPQLVNATITGLRARSWPIEDLRRMRKFELTGLDVEAERSAARRRIISTVPEAGRTLLYRLSLAIGRFDRQTALAVGAIEPSVPRPGEHLDQLIGPWIDQVDRAEFRISPLVSHAARDVLAPAEGTVVHRTIAETVMQERVIDVTRANAAFLHGLLGKAQTPLLKIAYSVISARPETRSMLAEWLTALRLHRTDRPIFQANMTLSRLLRLAQFLLCAQAEDGEATCKAWNALYAETQQESDDTARHTFEGVILINMLLQNVTANTIPDWFDLLLRLATLVKSVPDLRDRVNNLEQTRPNFRNPDLIGFLFIFNAVELRSVESLAALFDKVDALTPELRALMFAQAAREPDSFTHIVSAAWLHENERGVLDGAVAADRYARMAVQASGWGYRLLALRCHVARAIMLDEYANDSSAALAALEQAEHLIGSDPVILRAEGRIRYRGKAYHIALPLLKKSIATTTSDDAVERTFTLREIGICAGELGDWADANRWFTAARAVSASAASPDMHPMTIGLRADAAVAAFHDGDTATALRDLATTIGELSTLDPTSSTKAAYCHRIVRHVVLWLWRQSSGREAMLDEEPAAPRPGACSNPEPSEQFNFLPLSALEPVWYLLAELEMTTGVDAGIHDALPARLSAGTVPALEIQLHFTSVKVAIRRRNARALVASLPLWVNSQVYLSEHPTTLTELDLMNPSFGVIPSATPAQLRELAATRAASDAVLAFGVAAVLQRDSDALLILGKEAKRTLAADYPGAALAMALAGQSTIGNDIEQKAVSAMRVAIHPSHLSPDELFIVSVQILYIVAFSMYKHLLADSLGTWVCSCWSEVARTQRFRLRIPSRTAPEIEAAALSGQGLPAAASVLLAAEPAVNHRIGIEARKLLQSLSTSS